MEETHKKDLIHEILPKSGLVYSERGGLVEVLCKPKILPLRSSVLEKLKLIEQQADDEADEQKDGESKY